jgi:hypothetical protein
MIDNFGGERELRNPPTTVRFRPNSQILITIKATALILLQYLCSGCRYCSCYLVSTIQTSKSIAADHRWFADYLTKELCYQCAKNMNMKVAATILLCLFSHVFGFRQRHASTTFRLAAAKKSTTTTTTATSTKDEKSTSPRILVSALARPAATKKPKATTTTRAKKTSVPEPAMKAAAKEATPPPPPLVAKTLRPRQAEAVDALVSAMVNASCNHRALLVAPTGWGKTAVISKVIEELHARREVEAEAAEGGTEELPFKVPGSPFAPSHLTPSSHPFFSPLLLADSSQNPFLTLPSRPLVAPSHTPNP